MDYELTPPVRITGGLRVPERPESVNNDDSGVPFRHSDSIEFIFANLRLTIRNANRPTHDDFTKSSTGDRSTHGFEYRSLRAAYFHSIFTLISLVLSLMRGASDPPKY